MRNQENLTAASWHFNSVINGQNLASYMRFVSPPGAPSSCSSDSQCPNGQVCGIARNMNMVCGNLIGYWTADQVCGADASYGSPFNCNLQIGAPYGTLRNMYGCVPPSQR